MITFEEFKKMEIRIGRIVAAEKVQGTDKLLRLEIDLGDRKQQMVAGIADQYSPESILNKELPVLANLEPRKIRGIESQGMILAAIDQGKPVLLHPDREVPPGSSIS